MPAQQEDGRDDRREDRMRAAWLRWMFAVVGIFAAALAAPPARAGEFQPGTYSFTDAHGVKVWELHFARDPRHPTYFRVTGSVGSVVRVPVRGGYSSATNTLSAAWAPLPGSPFGLADLGGAWRADQDVFAVHYHGGPAIHLRFDADAPDPTATKLQIRNVTIEPAVSGAILKGRFTLAVSQWKGIEPLHCSLKVEDDLMAPGIARQIRGAWIDVPGDGEHVVDFAAVPVTVPVDASAIRVSVTVSCLDADPYSIDVTREVPVASLDKPVVVDSFRSTAPFRAVDPDEVSRIGYEFNLRSVVGPTGHKTRAKVFETVTITCEDRPREVTVGPRVELDLPTSPDADVGTIRLLPVQHLPSGDYHAVVRLEGPDLQTYNGVLDFRVGAPRRTSTPPRQDDPAAMTGTVAVAAPVLDPGEETGLVVRFGFEKGPPGVDADLDVEIVDPDGKVTSSAKRVSVRRGKPAERRFRVSSKTPGVHTVKARVRGERCDPWSQSATFTVKEPVVAPPPGTQPERTGATPGAEQGTFGLVRKVVGRAPEPGEGPYGTASGSISQNACSFRFEAKSPYDGTISMQATFSTPPAVLRPGDVIELTCSGSASESGKDKHNIGIGCGWEATGSCEVVERKKFFVGRSSDGKFHPSGQGAFKVKVESGGKIKLVSTQGGFAWGNGGVWNPCEYHYEWNAAPIDPRDAERGADATAQKGDATESSGATLVATDPADEERRVLRAWLDRDAITLFAGETGEIVDVHVEGFRTNTLDRVEVLFPQKTDNWASLPGRIIVDGGDGSYDPANMGRPVHVDGYFFSARHTALAAEVEIDIVVRQVGAGEERLKLAVRVVPKPAALDPLADPNAGGAPAGGAGNPPTVPPPPPTGRTQSPRRPPQGNPAGPPQTFAGRWTTTFGPVTLAQDGANVTGTYRGGLIRGTVAGDTFTFRLDERALTPIPGFGRWVLVAKGDAFDGVWSNAQDLSPPLRPWTGQRVTTGGASPHVPDPRGAEPTDPARPPADRGTSPATPGTLDLAPGKLAENRWNSVGDKGARVTVDGDALVFDVPRTSDGAAESFSATTLEGDFDVCIDYEHVDWNAGDEASLSWSAFLSPVAHTEARELIQVMRVSGEAFGEVIVNPSAQAEPISVPAVSDRKGTIRIARTGSTVRVWQADGSAWKQAAEFGTGLTGKLHLGFVLERQGDVGAKVRLAPRRTR